MSDLPTNDWKLIDEHEDDDKKRLFNKDLTNSFHLEPRLCFVVTFEPGAMMPAWNNRVLFQMGTNPFNGEEGAMEDKETKRLESVPDAKNDILQLFSFVDDGKPKIKVMLKQAEAEPDHGAATGVPDDH